jgi:hypothetical protein
VDRQAWTLVARTGHRTPDAGRGRGQVTTARPASGPPEPPRRATARWDAQPCSCGRAPAALGSPCRLGGEAAFQREIASRRQLLGRSARVERRLGALLSSDDFGSSVERSAKLHPLWQGQGAVLHVLDSVEASVWWVAKPGEATCRFGHGAALLNHRRCVGPRLAGVHLAKRPVEEHAQGHQQGDGAHAENGGDQPGPLDHHADQGGSDRDAGPLRWATVPVAITPPTAAAPLSGSQPRGCGIQVGRQ